MVRFCPLSSGSKGNSIFFQTQKTKILIDAGLSAKQLILRLQQINVDISEIDAILISHEHIDHIQSLKVLSLKYGIPVFANTETAKGIISALNGVPNFKIFTTGERFTFKDLSILPFSINHDTLDPVAFTIENEGVKFGVCTDLGFVTSLVRTKLEKCDYLYLEANHKPSLVLASSRPDIYKQRVLSRNGHLSNEACGELLTQIAHENLKHVHLAHLSSECNTPEIALVTVKEALARCGMQLKLSVAYQESVSEEILI
jgi:phosphoribosyl 1,2-cyclic phosphodiesterase